MENLTTVAARQALRAYGEKYAAYIERHTLELIEKGYLTEEVGMTRTLGEALAGNDGD